jgi:hypothetical protein
VLHLDHGYVVQFRALNEGGSTAAEVTIEGALLFTTDPRRGELRLRATGYAKP